MALIKPAGLERPVVQAKSRQSSQKMTCENNKAEAKVEQGDRLEAAIKRERLHVASIEREYAAKLDDLRHNYALRVTVEWVQALTVVAPVQRHEVLIKRRKGERSMAMDWHVAARRMEPAKRASGAWASMRSATCAMKVCT